MAVISLPTELHVMRLSWGQLRLDMSFTSGFGAQAVELNPPLWKVSMVSDRINEEMSSAWKVFLMQLKGRTNQVALYDLARPVPRGTMRGTMTLNALAVQGATTLEIIASGENTKTLKAGDWLGIGSGITQQLVMVMADATSDGSGIITVTIESSLRNLFYPGQAITWDKPTALFRRDSSEVSWEYEETYANNFGVDLIEDWRS